MIKIIMAGAAALAVIYATASTTGDNADPAALGATLSRGDGGSSASATSGGGLAAPLAPIAPRQAVEPKAKVPTLGEALDALGLDPQTLASIRSKAEEQGIRLDEANWLRPWSEVADEVHQHYFVATETELASWERLHTGKLFLDGQVSEGDLSKFIWRRDYEVTGDDLARAQALVDEAYPLIRAEARTVALEMASARESIWQRGMYARSPLVGVPDERFEGVKKRAIAGVGGGGGGWCVSYQLYREDHPSLDAAISNLAALKKKLNEDLALAFAMH